MGPGGSMGRLGDRFVLVRELGSGGMSRVFLGRDEVLDRPVAVKIVEPDPDDPEIGLRFQREGRSAARLSHPNIVMVFNAGEDEIDGRAVSYIVMEYVSGGDFEDLIDRNGPIPETMLLRIGADGASGLTHAHERGIIHRDIKPRNILLDERGSPKLADFGIARALDGTYLGTVAYSPQERRLLVRCHPLPRGGRGTALLGQLHRGRKPARTKGSRTSRGEGSADQRAARDSDPQLPCQEAFRAPRCGPSPRRVAPERRGRGDRRTCRAGGQSPGRWALWCGRNLALDRGIQVGRAFWCGGSQTKDGP